VAASAATDAPAFATALARDRGRTRERLSEALEDPALRAAIAVASPATDAAIAAWRRYPEDRKGRKTERALLRYLTRAAGRPTPFGLFAGVSVGRVGEATALALPPREAYASRTRISLAWATELAGALAGEPALRDRLVHRANPTLYRLPNRWRYVARREEDDNWIHALRQVRDRTALALVLERARAGTSLAELAELLVAEGKGTPAAARGYVDELVEQQLLLPELAPPVTGGEPADELLARLEAAGAGELVSALRGAARTVEALDRDGLGVDPERYRSVRAGLRDLQGAPVASQPLSIDLHKPAGDLTIGPHLVDALAHGVEVLRRWAPDEPDPLDRFRQAFQRRYGQREVPLVEALDDDAGVGLGVLDEPRPEVADVEARDRLLFAKLTDALRDGRDEIVVSADELERAPRPLPPSFAVGARVAAPSVAAIDEGDFELWLKSARGPDAMGMFARFCHGDAALREHVAAHLRAEEALDPDAVHAEIAHLPQLKLGGVLHRPLLRDVEIDYLGPSGAPADRRLQLDDLLISVVGERVLLRSRRDGRWVHPRLGAALNVDLNLPPAFRLLVFIERQDGMHLSWSWGSLRWAPYHPRVRAGRTVLAPAHWRLDEAALAPLTGGSELERFRAVAELRARLGLPRMVAVTDADNVLPVDLDSTVGVELLLGLMRGREEAHLFEVHPDPSRLCVEGPEGRFTNEVIVPFLARTPVRRAAPAEPVTALRRSFTPGSEWLYVKLYCGASATDALVRDRVGPLCAQLVADGVVDRWFFMRYGDPDLHVRVRLHGDPVALREQALPLIGELAEGLHERLLISHASLDTYEREVERYGGEAGMALCEDWFHADSEAAVAALGAGEGAEGRWRTALVATDAALAAFGLDTVARLEAMRAARAHRAAVIAREASGEPDTRSYAARYGERHRADREALELALHAARNGGDPGAFAAYRDRAERFEAIAAALLDAHRDGVLTASPTEIALSLVHMRLNRLLRVGSLEPELRLYDALERLYASELARSRQVVEGGAPSVG
jgi:lantibiotic biosynthesis protein